MRRIYYWSTDLIDRVYFKMEDDADEFKGDAYGIKNIARRVLTARQYQVFKYRHTNEHGKTLQEIADILHISVVAVHKLNNRLMERLKKEFEEEK